MTLSPPGVDSRYANKQAYGEAPFDLEGPETIYISAKSHRARKKRSHRQRSQHLEPQDLQQTTEFDGLEGHIPRPAWKALGHVVRFGRLGTDVVISLYIWTVCGSLVQEI